MYGIRHSRVLLAHMRPAETYLYSGPIPLHLVDGWVEDTTADGSGSSTPYDGGPVHHWQRLTWTPPRPQHS